MKWCPRARLPPPRFALPRQHGAACRIPDRASSSTAMFITVTAASAVAVVSMTRGAFRFATGQSNPARVPAANAAGPHRHRGTVLDIEVAAASTQVTVRPGGGRGGLARSSPRTCSLLATRGASVRVSSRSISGEWCAVQSGPEPAAGAARLGRVRCVPYGGGAAPHQPARAANGLPPVQTDARLIRAAQQQADAMASRTSMSHDAGGSFEQRMTSAGIRGWQAENIVAAAITVSPKCLRTGRCRANTMPTCCMTRCARIGLASSIGPDGRRYWTMVLTSQ